MPIQDISIPSSDGHPLAATCFTPEKDGGTIVLMCSAMAVRRQFYAGFLSYCMAQGCHAISFDYRGTGDSLSGSVKASQARLEEWGRLDISAVIEWITEKYPAHRLVMVAHSAGAQVFGLAHNNVKVSSFVAVASQSGYWAYWDWPHKLRIFFLWYFAIPVLTPLLGYFPGHWFGMGKLPQGVAEQWAQWGRNPHYVSDDNGLAIREHFHAYRGAVNLYAIADDPVFGPARAVKALAGFYENAAVKLTTVHPADYDCRHIGHFGFFRKSMPRSAWLQVLETLDIRQVL